MSTVDDARRARIISATQAKFETPHDRARLFEALDVLNELLLPGACVICKVADPKPLVTLASAFPGAGGPPPKPVPPSDWILISRSSAAILNEIERKK